MVSVFPFILHYCHIFVTLKVRYILLDIYLHRQATILRFVGLLDDIVKPILQKRSKLLLSCAQKLSQLGPVTSSSDANILWHYSKAFYFVWIIYH